MNERPHDLVICISDFHSPYGSEDAVKFLDAIKSKYWKKAKNPIVVNTGDELDYHSISFHGADPALMSPSDELESAIKKLSPLYEIFPKMLLCESNHGSLVYRKQKFHGLPRSVFKSYREILGAPRGWKWADDWTLKIGREDYCYFHHSKSAEVLKTSQSMGMSCVSGHLHEKFSLSYWANPNNLYFAMQIGCLIDNESLAFAYNKVNLKRPIIGTGIIVDGSPLLIPMKKNHRGQWIGKLPY
ncbi:phosphoesterase [Candidatus Dependentiae bacterium]|nr:MAG: phosphoesterase [Candidatus Dependentiae bacterium]